MAQAGRHRRRPHRALHRMRGTLPVLWRAQARLRACGVRARRARMHGHLRCLVPVAYDTAC
eukprot:scaffold38584_cov36-Phaeocystis_antarctica.AAC.1